MRGKRRTIPFSPVYQMGWGEAWQIVKLGLDDADIPLGRKVQAIGIVARMETLNSITKAELQRALRWLVEHYDFEV